MTVDAHGFLNTVFEGVPEGESVLTAAQFGKGFSNIPFPSQKFDRKFKQARSALYFNIATVTAPDPKVLDERGNMAFRRRGEDCHAVYCMVLDDINEDGQFCKYDSKTNTLVKGPEIGTPPSWILETSPGNFQWGYLLEPTEELERFSALMDAMADAQFTDKGAKGFNRLMRFPGSVNTKPGKNNFSARLCTWAPEIVFDTVDDIAAAFQVQIGAVKPRATKSRAPAAVIPELEVNDPVVDWLYDREMVLDTDGEWLIIRCPNCDAHTTGDDTARYSPLGTGAGDWKFTRGFKCFHDHCQDFDFLEWVSDHGGPFARRFDPLPFLQHSYVYVQDGRRICNLDSLARGGLYDCSLEEFSDMFAHVRVHMPTPKDKKRHVMAKTAFMEEPDTIKVRRYDVIPYTTAEPQYAGILTDHAGEQVINTYRPAVHDAKPANLDVFLEHMEFLLPNGNDCMTFLDWLAFKLQHPRMRSYGVVMIAEDTFGIGRSWLGDVLRAVWTPNNVKSVDIGDLTGHGPSAGYNDWASGSQLVVIEEAHDGGDITHYKAYERIKTLIDPRVTEMHINTKFGAKRQEKIWFNLLVFSNHVDAFSLPKGERRLAIFANPTQRQDNDYYTRLWNTYLHNGAGFAAGIHEFLMERDVSGFNHSMPPETEAKADMIVRSAAPGDIIANTIVESSIGELVTRNTLFDLWEAAERCERLENTMTNNTQRRLVDKLWSGLPRLRDHRNGFRSRVGGRGVEEIRALRSVEHWQNVVARGSLSGADLKSELAKAARGIGDKRWTRDGVEVI